MPHKCVAFALRAGIIATVSVASPAFAAGAQELGQLSPLFGLPFAGLLLTIALCPLLATRFWHYHFGKLAALWAMAVMVPLALALGVGQTAHLVIHSLLSEYLPFILLLGVLYTLAGGIHIKGRMGGKPLSNTLLLALGAGLASLIGTTGAAMVLVRPLTRANAARRFNAHVLVFFIFLVANIGGALSPLGDPPLFLGFLRGVDFFWPLRALWPPVLLCIVALLLVFFALDSLQWRRETSGQPAAAPEPLGVEGLVNLPLLALAIGLIIVCAAWHPGNAADVLGTQVPLENLVRDGGLGMLIWASLAWTKPETRIANGFEWAPMVEVAKLFAAIFICIIPVLAMLKAGMDGPFAPLLQLVTHKDATPVNPAYFWATGLLSAILDNAPTYLVFFDMAGGDPALLSGPMSSTLAAVSLGAVFMGAITYIGNAPNFMVYAIARRSGIKMPGFFGYMLWSSAVLLPLFGLVTLIFIR